MANQTPVVIKNGQTQQLQAGDSLVVATQSVGDNSTKVATTAFVLANGGAPTGKQTIAAAW